MARSPDDRTLIAVALGANLPGPHGDPVSTLAAARNAMRTNDIAIDAESSIWLTAPVPASDQPWYHNQVVTVRTPLSPYALLERLQAIEQDFGRVRTVRNAPRILDLDLIAYGDAVLDKPDLIVPHPRMQDRAFVLLPLREVAAGWRHPLLARSLDDLIALLPPGQQADRMAS